jgi:hypothetical protein
LSVADHTHIDHVHFRAGRMLVLGARQMMHEQRERLVSRAEELQLVGWAGEGRGGGGKGKGRGGGGAQRIGCWQRGQR